MAFGLAGARLRPAITHHASRIALEMALIQGAEWGKLGLFMRVELAELMAA